MANIGNIHKAIDFGRSKLGKWRYDHMANQATRFGQTNVMADCSGFVSRCLWEGGMPRMNMGFGESSNAMAAWVRRNPQYRLPLQAQATVFGCVIVYGGLGGAGDAGHVVFGLGDGTVLGSSSSTNGVAIRPLSHFLHADGGVSDVMLAPVNYGTPPAPIPKPPPSEDDMFRILEDDTDKTIWLTNWLEKRKIDSLQEAEAIITAGVTGGAAVVPWPHPYIANIPVSH